MRVIEAGGCNTRAIWINAILDLIAFFASPLAQQQISLLLKSNFKMGRTMVESKIYARQRRHKHENGLIRRNLVNVKT
jgi:hypothetical protein